MADFVTLTCPTCGGKLQITPDIDRFACTHCGNEHLVKRTEGVIAIQPLTESLTGLKRATDRTASELAIRRLREDLSQLQTARQQAEGRAAEHRKVLAAHDAHKVGCQSAVFGIVTTPLCLVAYLVSDGIAKDVPEGSFLAGLPYWILILLAIFGLMTVWFGFKWLATTEPTPNRKIAGENLLAAQAEIATLAAAMGQKQAEIGEHQQFVALGG